jgi:hypothetical protein
MIPKVVPLQIVGLLKHPFGAILLIKLGLLKSIKLLLE